VPATSAQAFQVWCRFLAPTEGGFSNNVSDPGNWTSGKPGLGELHGTKFGIAASGYPNLNIEALTIEEADALRKQDFWDRCNGDLLPPSVAFVLCEAMYGSGPATGIMQMQAMLGVVQDGFVGERETIPAIEKAIGGPAGDDAYGLDPLEEFLCAFSSRRLLFESGLGNWSEDKGGWTVRLFRGLTLALSLA
jgi:lysozyme family protein